MKNLIKIFILSLIVSSCGEFEPVVYDNINGQTLLKFTQGSSDLRVEINDVGEAQIEVSSSTLDDVDRSFNLVVDPSSTSAQENYNVPATVVIPANSYTGTFTVTGVDVSVETTTKTIVVGITSNDGSVSNGNHTINIFEICPIPEDYLVGSYMIEDVMAVVGPDNGTENFASGIVTISVNPDASTERIFEVGVLPAFAGNRTIALGLVCNKLILSDVDPNLTCGGGIAYLLVQAGDNNSSYDISDDSELIVNYLEDPEGSCGGPFDSSFRLIKQ